MTLPYDAEPMTNYGVGHLTFNRSFTQLATGNASGSGFFDLWDNVNRTRLSSGAWPWTDGVGTFIWNDAGRGRRHFYLLFLEVLTARTRLHAWQKVHSFLQLPGEIPHFLVGMKFYSS